MENREPRTTSKLSSRRRRVFAGGLRPGLFDLRSLIAGRDADTVRTIVLVSLAVVLSSLLFWILGSLAGFSENGIVRRALSAAANSAWLIPAIIAIFIAGSFIGAPQFLLIALSVGALGPWSGGLVAYVGTLMSAAINFFLARWFGAGWLKRRKSVALLSIVETVGRNGFISSMAVRIVPSAPFIVVNMALGLTTVPFMTFLAGTAIGSIPKTVLVALLGKVAERAMDGDLLAIGYMALAAAAWVALAVLARKVVQRTSPPAAQIDTAQTKPD